MRDSFSIIERLHYQHRFWRYSRRTEPDTIHFIRTELQAGQTALDIGANKGVVTYFLARQVGPGGRVVAFEPQPEMNPLIRRMARSFGLENVSVETLGLSDHEGQVSLFRGKAGTTGNLEANRSWQCEEIPISITTLDHYVATREPFPIHFIKCDVDDHESKVLAGAADVLRTHRPKLLIEISEENLGNITEMLRCHGYNPGEFWFRGRRYPASESGNYPFRHAHARFRNFLFTAA